MANSTGRPRGRGARFMMTLLLVALVLSFAPQAFAAGAAALESCFLSEINSARAATGAGPLSSSSNLGGYGRTHSQGMAASGDLYHSTTADLSPYLPAGWRSWGENVGYATGSEDCGFLFQGFWNSPNHRANLLNPSFDTVGIGVYIDPADVMWTTHVFVDTAAPTPTTTTTTTTATTTTTTTLPPTTTTTAPPGTTTTTTTTMPSTTTTTASTITSTTAVSTTTSTTAPTAPTSSSTPTTVGLTTIPPSLPATSGSASTTAAAEPTNDAAAETATAADPVTSLSQPAAARDRATAQHTDPVPAAASAAAATPDGGCDAGCLTVDPLLAALALFSLSGGGLAWWLLRR